MLICSSTHVCEIWWALKKKKISRHASEQQQVNSWIVIADNAHGKHDKNTSGVYVAPTFMHIVEGKEGWYYRDAALFAEVSFLVHISPITIFKTPLVNLII